MKAELVPENGDPPIPITRDVTVVGRREFCDIQINDPSLSKRHCLLVRTDGLLVIRDLGTTNGTKVKGQRVRWAALLPEDRITLGSYKLRIYLGSDDAPSPSELARSRPAARAVAPRPVPGAPSGREVEVIRLGPQTPVVVPAHLGRVGEDDMNWQNLRAIEDEDVIIELD
jgi:hypothetical protein